LALRDRGGGHGDAVGCRGRGGSGSGEESGRRQRGVELGVVKSGVLGAVSERAAVVVVVVRGL